MSILEQYGLTSRFLNESTMYPELVLARVIAQHRGMYKIVTEAGEIPAEISGKFRYQANELAMFPTVGDYVMVSMNERKDYGIIHHILSRKSAFFRTAVGVSGQAQCVASNIDTIFICMSLNHNFNLSRLERYHSVAWDSGATPVILLTKADLCKDIEKAVSDVERVSLFSEVITLSVFDDDVEDKLSKFLKTGTTSALIGSSGVGKSTLINRLLGETILNTASCGKLDKGRHTTTGRELFTSSFGGALIDTPGMRELGAESVDLDKTFDDIEQLISQCKFHDCTHVNEPGCAILRALEEKTLDERRYQNYCKLKTEAGYEGLSAKEIEVKKLERMFKDVGGMKSGRKNVKRQKLR